MTTIIIRIRTDGHRFVVVFVVIFSMNVFVLLQV